jgi:hypothetical protein
VNSRAAHNEFSAISHRHWTRIGGDDLAVEIDEANLITIGAVETAGRPTDLDGPAPVRMSNFSQRDNKADVSVLVTLLGGHLDSSFSVVIGRSRTLLPVA